MTFIVNENCRFCRYTDCVTVCPVDCFYEYQGQLYIHPDECIDCGACEPECPVEAIVDEVDLSNKDKKRLIDINIEKAEKGINHTEKIEPLKTAVARKKELGF